METLDNGADLTGAAGVLGWTVGEGICVYGREERVG